VGFEDLSKAGYAMIFLVKITDLKQVHKKAAACNIRQRLLSM
jgi:hypothetical protein